MAYRSSQTFCVANSASGLRPSGLNFSTKAGDSRVMAQLSRRSILAVAAASGVLVEQASRAQAGEPQSGEAQARERLALTPQVTEGPYYLPNAPLRADLTEGLSGVPVELRFEVVDKNGARLSGAHVDVWHCDAKGRYSGFGGAPGEPPDTSLGATRFLRGMQPTDASGVAVFHTVYPGWYMGRTTHAHYKVWWNAVAVLTGQIFLPDALNEFLYTQSADYRQDQMRDTLNRDDGIAVMAGPLALGALKDAGDRYVVTQAVVVDRAARPVADRGPGEPRDRGFGPPPPNIGPPHRFAADGGQPPFGPPPPGASRRGPSGRPMRPALTGDARLTALLPGDDRKT